MSKRLDDIIKWARDYLGDTTRVVIGISGGKDSSITAALLAKAIGPERIIAVMMPQGIQHDQDKARELIKFLGLKSYEFNIRKIQNTFDFMLKEEFGDAVETNAVYYSNNPARIRMTILYAVAALLGNCRVANTSNRTEDYVGYATKWGDSAGDFSLLLNLTVREVKALGYELLPASFVEKIPEDGLSGKTDEDNLGFSYDTVDAYLLDGVLPDAATLENIERRHRANLHKLQPMPAYTK